MTNRCKIEILTGKKGKFTLSYYEDNTDNVYELPIKIKSMQNKEESMKRQSALIANNFKNTFLSCEKDQEKI